MAEKYHPRDWAAMKQALFDWATASVRSGVLVYWGEQDAPSPDLAPGRVRLNIISPAQARGQDEERSSGIHVVIATVQDSTDYTVTLGGSSFAYSSGVGETAESIRDALLAVIDAGAEPVTVTPYGDDRIRVVFTEGDLAASSSANIDLKKRLEMVGTRELTLSIEVMANKGTDLAIPVLEELRGGLENAAFAGILRAGGWAWIEVIGTRKGDAHIGAKWQERAGFDLRLYCRSLNVGEIDWIETVEVVPEGLIGA